MVPSGGPAPPPPPPAGAQPVPASLLRSNSGAFSPRTNFNMLLNHSFDSDPLSSISFNAPYASDPPPQLDPQFRPVKLEPDLRTLSAVKLEPQAGRGLPPVKLEPQPDQSLFMHQQQQQQQLLHMSRHSSQAQINLLHQHRFLQLQQQQQQQLLKAMPQQRPPPLPLQQRSPVKPAYEPGMCARRLTSYMHQQQQRPQDNNIEFWRKFVADFFAPHAKKKWCVSMYGSGRQTTGVFPQDVWHCEICNRKPGRGFEATVEVLPRLFKIKYESGTLEELLYIDMPREYHNSSGQIVLDYAKAIQESVFEQLRVVRDGQLRIVFSLDLKICSWEFCARRHEELIPRRLLVPQVTQLGNATQKYQATTQNAASNLSLPEMQNNCNMFVASARQLAKTLEVPLVNDLGYTKRYVRCLQISEVVNSMKDLIDYSRETGTGPMESLNKFPRRTSTSTPSGLNSGQPQQSEEQVHQHRQQQESNGDQIAAINAAAAGAASTSSTSSTIVGMLHQNSMNSRQMNNSASSPYGGGGQIASPGGSSTSIPPPHTQPSPSPFQSPTPSSSNNNNNPVPQTSHMSTANSPANISMQQQSLSGDADPAVDSQSSVQKILHEMMMSNPLNVNDMKNVNGILPAASVGLLGNGNGNNSSMGVGVGMGMGMGMGMGVGMGMGGVALGQSTIVNGIRSVMGHGSMMNGNGRAGMASIGRDQMMHHHHQQQQQQQQQQDLGNPLLSGIGAANGFNNNLQFDWKPSP